MSDATTTHDRGIDHELEDDTDKTGDATALPATPDERMEAAIQMDKIRRYTVRPGLLRLPVEELTTAANSPSYVLQLYHPTVDAPDVRFFIQKPDYWDPTEYLWPRFLGWYGYTTRNQYQLQTDHVYVRYDRQTDEWELTKPPSDARRYWWRWRDAVGHRTPNWFTHRIRGARRRVRSVAPSGNTAVGLFVALLTYTVAFTSMAVTGATTADSVLVALIGVVLVLGMYAVAVQPPGGDDA